MNTALLIGVFAYEIIVIVGLGLWLQRRHAKQVASADEFALAGRDLPVPVVAVTLALTVLGTAHILGVFEMTWHMGAVAIWFSIAHVILLTFVCLGTGAWFRRLKVQTVPELLQQTSGTGTRLLVSCVMAGVLFGILTVEAQGIGIIIQALTGWPIHQGAIIGGILGLLYVLLAGMREIGWVNLVNSIVMYAGLILATIFVGAHFAGGYEAVGEYYQSNGLSHMTSIWGTKATLINFGFVMVVAVLFSQSINQMLIQPAMSAKDEATVKKALWIAAPVNGMFGVFAIAIALMARSQPEYAALEAGAKIGSTTMLVDVLPPWLAAVLLAAFLAAILSTFAIIALSIATIFTNDIYKALYKPDASAKSLTNMIRAMIIIVGGVAIAIASFMPPILAAMIWLFAWLVPVFFIIMYGIFVRRHSGLCLLTLATTWVINSLWTFTSLPLTFGFMRGVPPDHVLNADNYNAYVMAILSIVVLTIGHFMTKGEPGLFRSDSKGVA